MKTRIRLGFLILLALNLVMAAFCCFVALDAGWSQKRANRAHARLLELVRTRAAVDARLDSSVDDDTAGEILAARLAALSRATETGFKRRSGSGDADQNVGRAATLDVLLAGPLSNAQQQKARGILQKWHDLEVDEVRRAEQAVAVRANRLTITAIVLALIGCALTAVLILGWMPRITRRLDHIMSTLGRVGQGDLDARILDQGRDELGLLARTMDRVADERDRLTVSRNELEEAIQLAQSANRSKSRFLANMSHEIRTPMNGVTGMIDLALSQAQDVEVRECLHTAKDASRALLDVINDILDFSRIEAGHIEILPQDFDLNEVISAVCRTLAALADQKGLEMTVEMAPAVPKNIRADAGRLRQVLLNLLGNAIKFTKRGEVGLKVTAAPTDAGPKRLVFEVWDTGPGINKDALATIFDAFSQLQASHAATVGGTGLGLSISRELARAMGGDITVESDIGVGSRFVVTMPYEAGVDVQPSTLEAATASLARRPILIVDDNSTNRRILSSLVERWGMVPHTASSVADARDMLIRSKAGGPRFSIVLLDWVMDEEDGLDLARFLRNDPDLNATPVLVLSSSASVLAAAAKAGVHLDGCLRKPVEDGELLRAMASALNLVGSPDSGAHESDAAPSSLENLQVLVAEDNPVNQTLARKLLTRAGCQLVIANDGEEAVRAYRSQTFDIVLMDLQMPTMDGFQATAAIRHIERNTDRRTPILAVTAYAMKADEERCRQAGMDGFITKPIDVKNLLAAISSHRRPPTEARVPTASLPPVLADDDFSQQLFELFLSTLPEQLEQFEAELAAREVDALARTVHSLKGSLISLGDRTDGVAASATLLEHRLRSGEADELTWTLARNVGDELKRIQVSNDST